MRIKRELKITTLKLFTKLRAVVSQTKRVVWSESLRWTVGKGRSQIVRIGDRDILDLADANSALIQALNSGEAFVFSRLGTTESRALHSLIVRRGDVLDPHSAYFDPDLIRDLWKLSGVFPPHHQNIADFTVIYRDALSSVDFMAVRTEIKDEYPFLKNERQVISKFLPKTSTLVDLDVTFPFGLEDSWTASLKGRKVLVVHPFANSITFQSLRLKEIFGQAGFVDPANLIVIPPPQTLGATPFSEGFANWVDALHNTESLISNLDFDVALIGAGAYGLPLAAFIKSRGKQAIHVGGTLQLYFGIVGRRWEEDPQIRTMLNECWVRPNSDERVEGYLNVEGGCYW